MLGARTSELDADALGKVDQGGEARGWGHSKGCAGGGYEEGLVGVGCQGRWGHFWVGPRTGGVLDRFILFGRIQKRKYSVFG